MPRTRSVTCLSCGDPLVDPYPRTARCRPCQNQMTGSRASQDATLRRRYGIDSTVYRALEIAQQGECAICGAPSARLHVDHDHETGLVRGLLCPTCNMNLAVVEDAAFNQVAGGYLAVR
jgi:hypothetical protein